MADEKPQVIPPAPKKAEPKKTHVKMQRNAEQYPAPHTANVHVDEVANWAKHGWETC